MGSVFRKCKKKEISMDGIDSDICVEHIHTIKLNLSREIAVFLMNIIYNRIGIPVGNIKILVEGVDYTIFMADNISEKERIVRELSLSEIRYTD